MGVHRLFYLLYPKKQQKSPLTGAWMRENIIKIYKYSKKVSKNYLQNRKSVV